MAGPKRPDDPTRPGGARWCEEHAAWECTKPRSKGRGTCHGAAITGTDSCRMHAGVSADVARARGEAITAFSALTGQPAVDPGRAVLAMLHLAWLRVHLLASLLEAQVAAQGGSAGDVPDDVDDVAPAVGDGPSTGGLVGHVYAPAKDGGRIVTGEAPRALVVLEAQERDRVVRFAKTAHDMGISEREVRIAEQQGQLLAQVVTGILGDLQLTPEQQRLVSVVVPRHLRAVAEIEGPGGGAA